VARDTEAGVAVGADELLGMCRAKLARFKVPRHVLCLEASELPTTPTGKVQKYRLVQRAAEALARGLSSA